MLAGGRRGEHCWGRLLGEVWWFLNWLLPPRSHPALLFKWITNKKATQQNHWCSACLCSTAALRSSWSETCMSCKPWGASLTWHWATCLLLGGTEGLSQDEMWLRHADPSALAVLCSCVHSHSHEWWFWRAGMLTIVVRSLLNLMAVFLLSVFLTPVWGLLVWSYLCCSAPFLLPLCPAVALFLCFWRGKKCLHAEVAVFLGAHVWEWVKRGGWFLETGADINKINIADKKNKTKPNAELQLRGAVEDKNGLKCASLPGVEPQFSCWVSRAQDLLTAGQLEVDDLKAAFQPKPLCDSGAFPQ